MADLSDFYPLIRPYVSGVPNSVMSASLIKSAREFCSSTASYKTTVTGTLLDGAQDVAITLPDDLYQIDYVMSGDQTFTLVDELPDSTDSATPRYVAPLLPSSLRFDVLADKDTDFSARIVLRPSLSATTIDDNLFYRWGEVIAFGACFDIQSQLGKPWANPDAAGVMRSRYKSGEGRAQNANVGNNLQVASRRWLCR